MATSVRVLGNRLLDRRPQFWRTLVIVAITLALAYYLGRKPSIRFVQIPVLLLGLWAIFRYPGLGLLAVLVSAAVIPFAIGTGTQTALHLAFVLIPALFGLWIARMLLDRSFRLVPSITTFPAISLALVTTLALIYGNLPLNEFAQHAPARSQIGGWAIIVFSVGAFLLVGNQLKDIRWLKLLVGIFLCFGAIYFFSHAVPGMSGLARLFPVGATDSMFWFWFVALAGAQVLFNSDLDVRLRLLAGLFTGVAFGVAYSPGQFDWASGWLPCTVVLGVLIYLRWPRLGMAFGVIGLLVGFLGFNTIARVALTPDNQYSLLTRTAALQVVGQIIRANPLLGVGPANYYWYTPFYSLLGYYVRFNSHNQYVDILAQIGVLGMVVYLWLALAVARVGLQLRHTLQDGFARAYACAAVAGLAGMLVAGLLGDWVLPFVYNVGVRGFRSSVIGWLFLGGLVTLQYLSRQKPQDGGDAPAQA